jgi:hypothetical protein
VDSGLQPVTETNAKAARQMAEARTGRMREGVDCSARGGDFSVGERTIFAQSRGGPSFLNPNPAIRASQSYMKPFFLRHLLAIAGFLVLVASSISAQEPAASPAPPAKAQSRHEDAIYRQWKNISQANASVVEMAKATQATGVIAVLAPFALPVFIVAIAAYAKYRRTQTLHETLRLMVEKGVTIPPELLVPPKPAPNDFRRGVLLIGFGMGLTGLLATVGHRGLWSLGLVGVGYLVVARLGTKPPAGPSSSLPA